MGVLVPSILGSLRRPIGTDGVDSITGSAAEGRAVEGRTGRRGWTGELMRLNEGQKRGGWEVKGCEKGFDEG